MPQISRSRLISRPTPVQPKIALRNTAHNPIAGSWWSGLTSKCGKMTPQKSDDAIKPLAIQVIPTPHLKRQSAITGKNGTPYLQPQATSRMDTTAVDATVRSPQLAKHRNTVSPLNKTMNPTKTQQIPIMSFSIVWEELRAFLNSFFSASDLPRFWAAMPKAC